MKKFSKMALCAAVAVAITMGGAFSGCVTVNEEDVKQVVSTVDIRKSESFSEEFSSYAAAVEGETVTKRDLIVAFLNTGYSMVQNGSTYRETFDYLSEALVENAVVTQYATSSLLKHKVEAGEADLSTFNAKETQQEKLEYLLGGADSKGVKSAKYTLYSSLNSLLDSYEESHILDSDDDDEYSGSGSRSTPTNVDTENDDYLPENADGTLNYGVYTGYSNYLLASAGDEYEPLDGTNRNTRRKAYADFVTYLKNNYLLTDEDEENLSDVLKLSYVHDMYVSQLQQEVVSEFEDVYSDEQEVLIDSTDGGVYTYVQDRYNKILADQEKSYSDTSSFETAMDSMSDTSFILYSPATNGDTEEIDGTYATYGYVYNILLPFSTQQSVTLTYYQTIRDKDENDSHDESEYYVNRNKLLKNITTYDRREAWFNGTTDYSFDAEEYNEDNADTALNYYTGGDSTRKYLFFENNLTNNEKYKSLEKYTGLYTFNGKVTKNADGSYKLVYNKLSIDDMLDEFVAYINFVLGDSSAQYKYGDSLTSGSDTSDSYYAVTDYKKDGDETELDYSLLVYATGKVDFGSSNASDEKMFTTDSVRYKVMSAVNELQYAYTTDTGVLSEYIGYSVSAYTTSYIAEFEYAAQKALREGVGSFKVCAGDYGWHLIYVTDTFSVEGGANYTPNFTKENIENEGTFEYRFYSWLKDSALENSTTYKRNEVLRLYSTAETVSTDKTVYEDLASLST